MASKYIKWFSEIDKGDTATVGGKGANLGELTGAGFPVPPGFVVSSNAYFDVIEHNNLKSKIASFFAFTNLENTKELVEISRNIQSLILSSSVPKPIIHAIVDAYSRLGSDDPLVAVRSSATAEDLPSASFAGQQETYLNIKGDHILLDRIRACWASLFTERAIYYRHQNNFDHMEVGLAAVVEKMIQSDVSGIAFSIDPVTNNKSVITIEAIYGLGEYIVQGKVTPDHYEVIKKDCSILEKEIKKQTIAYERRGRKNVEIKIPLKFQEKQKLSDSQIVELGLLIKNIEKHYFFPQDIEWALEKGKLFIVQSRPITTLNNDKVDSEKHLGTVIVKGDPASPGLGVGRPVIINDPHKIDKMQRGDILIASMTDPDYVPVMKKASGIVTERGGRTSHAAIVSRELGLPAVVGAVDAIKLLSPEPVVSVNGSTGEVFRGSVRVANTSSSNAISSMKKLKTITKIYVNLAEVERAREVASLHVDGVGLLRAEFMIADIGVHPKEFIKSNTQNIFIDKLASKLKKFTQAFSPRPVVYRATDFKTNEYRNLKGGANYEPKEENPMLGYRGAARYIADRHVFKMEMEAIRQVREDGYKNLHLMIPFIRSPLELVEIKKMLLGVGLRLSQEFKLWIMVEIPSVALNLDDYVRLGIDGVSIGTNDLTMLTLGVDRDNESVAHLYKETDPAVVYLLEKIVKTAKKAGITVSVCGQAASDYADIREKLIKWGVTSLSINVDAVDRVRQEIYEFEKKIWQK